MLFLLTGDIQIGKTRWLESLAQSLAQQCIECRGVIAPGIWVESTSPAADANGFEKLGIDNVLLPQGERISFAKRVDLAEQAGTFNAESQAGRAKLGWHISDDAIARVNGHFQTLAEEDEAVRTNPQLAKAGRLLIVDELGRLELLRGEGLTNAMTMLSAGPVAENDHALIIVRETLVDIAEEKYASAWGACQRIAPNGEALALVEAALGL